MVSKGSLHYMIMDCSIGVWDQITSDRPFHLSECVFIPRNGGDASLLWASNGKYRKPGACTSKLFCNSNHEVTYNVGYHTQHDCIHIKNFHWERCLDCVCIISCRLYVVKCHWVLTEMNSKLKHDRQLILHPATSHALCLVGNKFSRRGHQ